MNIYIEKTTFYGFRYIATWVNSENYVFSDLYKTLKELKDYFQAWDNVEFVYTWKEGIEA